MYIDIFKEGGKPYFTLLCSISLKRLCEEFLIKVKEQADIYCDIPAPKNKTNFQTEHIIIDSNVNTCLIVGSLNIHDSKNVPFTSYLHFQTNTNLTMINIYKSFKRLYRNK